MPNQALNKRLRKIYNVWSLNIHGVCNCLVCSFFSFKPTGFYGILSSLHSQTLRPFIIPEILLVGCEWHGGCLLAFLAQALLFSASSTHFSIERLAPSSMVRLAFVFVNQQSINRSVNHSHHSSFDNLTRMWRENWPYLFFKQTVEHWGDRTSRRDTRQADEEEDQGVVCRGHPGINTHQTTQFPSCIPDLHSCNSHPHWRNSGRSWLHTHDDTLNFSGKRPRIM